MEKVTENCISVILSFTSPLDTCRASCVSNDFKSAADSDELWNKFLPSDIHPILSRSVSIFNYNTKRQLYFLLCDSPLLLDDGNLSFSLDKRSGKKCLMVAARQLSISWGDTTSYWSWESNYNSRFSEVAVLQYVWWLDIRGKMKTGMLSPHTTYETYLVYKLYENAYGLDSANASIRFVNEREDVPVDEANTIYPDTRAYNSEQRIGEVSRRRKDEWLEIKTGEFETGARDDDEVETRFMSIEGQVKGGLIVQGIEFRPKQSMTVV
ncbi:putative F-box domain, Phloem protein 2-like protein [Heracleum sosnowskyi]|uniref:F-box domain, Phloem protein 2-like protein n=1 Tax=Heracleum sosnowskyi TaxID=360622 RepID=A0AAD8MHN0_9APIA|nr:putative F-box domain, Phloem protein 2-like protein [Heracleum sosnowskyi]